MVSFARTALKLGLEELGAKPNQVILVPDYCCDVILHPLNELGLKLIYYEVSDKLSPHWDQLNEIDTKNIFGILMIHYFGHPQDIGKFQDYCRYKGIYLIEDNAHGFGGCFNGQCLGTFGDMGISSPRKIIKTSLGGVLYLRNKPTNIDPDESLPKLSIWGTIICFVKILIYRCVPVYRYLLYWNLRNVDFSNPHEFRERVQRNSQISIFDSYIIKNSNIKTIAKNRMKLWFKWKEYLSNQGLEPVFAKIGKQSCPWVIAFYCDDICHRNFWIQWGLNNRINLFSWPCLPRDQIQKNTLAFKRWERVVCVTLDMAPPITAFQNSQ